ncbi:MAG: hypothetical protein PHD13_02120 [Methanocellales archaeon]|nr:hypothetical protein [Methanocellales archaeon]MDD3291072.1 hypothetical protein [Methanocellales archaeon]MDD5234957.1 hypothetical protein [Methanocellales archaeon]MDD5484672.1 hypothetical protein [Methanocellales archaeon]
MEAEKKDIPEEGEAPEELYYSGDEYYWLKVEDGNLRMGFTPVGAEVHGIRTITIKPIGTYLVKGASFAGYMGTLAGGLFMPISGTITDFNRDLKSKPQLINSDPENSGWLIKIQPSKFEEEVEELIKVTPEKPSENETEEEEPEN